MKFKRIKIDNAAEKRYTEADLTTEEMIRYRQLRYSTNQMALIYFSIKRALIVAVALWFGPAILLRMTEWCFKIELPGEHFYEIAFIGVKASMTLFAHLKAIIITIILISLGVKILEELSNRKLVRKIISER